MFQPCALFLLAQSVPQLSASSQQSAHMLKSKLISIGGICLALMVGLHGQTVPAEVLAEGSAVMPSPAEEIRTGINNRMDVLNDTSLPLSIDR